MINEHVIHAYALTTFASKNFSANEIEVQAAVIIILSCLAIKELLLLSVKALSTPR